MKRLGLVLRLTVFLALSHYTRGITLSVPTTDVLVDTFVDCAWTATSADPVTFNLVMQYNSATGVEFGNTTLVVPIRRTGHTTNGTITQIKNVIYLGPHRLSAYADPFVATSTPLALSPTFNVVSSPVASISNHGSVAPSTTASSSNSATTVSDLSTSTPSLSSTSEAGSTNHNTIIIALSLICAVLVACIAGFVILRRCRCRKTRTAPRDQVQTLELAPFRVEPFSGSAFVSSSAPTLDAVPPFVARHGGTPRRTKTEVGGVRVRGLDGEVLPPAYSDVTGSFSSQR